MQDLRTGGHDGALTQGMGAQFYARRGVAVSVISFLGRWGSATVERYVADALNERAAWAPIAAAGEMDLSDVIAQASGRELGPKLGEIAGLVKEVVRSEVSAALGATTRERGASTLEVESNCPGAMRLGRDDSPEDELDITPPAWRKFVQNPR